MLSSIHVDARGLGTGLFWFSLAFNLVPLTLVLIETVSSGVSFSISMRVLLVSWPSQELKEIESVSDFLKHRRVHTGCQTMDG